ncbi:GrpB family protein [Chungangia koreensis]|uniref:GrpB family protein n=1 Tax=Chungangia koreensis TaxID=752657 RepID=A0ABV8X1U0_9LACT
MKLGLKNDEVRLETYDPEWKQEFERVKQTIMKFTGLSQNRIEHIGSTAVEGISSKPVIDILIGVDDLEQVEKQLIDGLKQAGFLRLKVKRPGEIVLAKFLDESYDEKTHYIHLTDYHSELWKNLIFFRDYLNANEYEKEKYEKLKLDYVKRSSTGIIEYTDFKERFVLEVFMKRSEEE